MDWSSARRARCFSDLYSAWPKRLHWASGLRAAPVRAPEGGRPHPRQAGQYARGGAELHPQSLIALGVWAVHAFVYGSFFGCDYVELAAENNETQRRPVVSASITLYILIVAIMLFTRHNHQTNERTLRVRRMLRVPPTE